MALAPLGLLLLPSLLIALATTALLLRKMWSKMRQRGPPAPPPPRWAELAPPLRALLCAALPLLTLVLGALQLDGKIALSWWAANPNPHLNPNPNPNSNP